MQFRTINMYIHWFIEGEIIKEFILRKQQGYVIIIIIFIYLISYIYMIFLSIFLYIIFLSQDLR